MSYFHPFRFSDFCQLLIYAFLFTYLSLTLVNIYNSCTFSNNKIFTKMPLIKTNKNLTNLKNIFTKTYLYYIYPTSGINVLHNLHVHPIGLQFFILALNSFINWDSLISCGTKCHVLGPLNDRVSDPH